MNETIPLPTRFADRAAMLAHVAALSGLDDAASAVPDIAAGGRKAAEAALAVIDPRAYAASRNHLDGAVTRLSPYIRHGILSLDEVRNAALASVGDPKQAEKFIQELAWRDYWQRIYLAHPERIWRDVRSGALPVLFHADRADDLLQAVWREETATSSNVVEVYVRYLRQKLEAEDQGRLLHTVRGRGYCLGAERAGA